MTYIFSAYKISSFKGSPIKPIEANLVDLLLNWLQRLIESTKLLARTTQTQAI
jgi:hypothetical protein